MLYTRAGVKRSAPPKAVWSSGSLGGRGVRAHAVPPLRRARPTLGHGRAAISGRLRRTLRLTSRAPQSRKTRTQRGTALGEFPSVEIPASGFSARWRAGYGLGPR